MDIGVAAGLFVVGLGLIFHFREEFVKGAVGATSGLGMASFIISSLLVVMAPGFLIVGAAGAFRGLAGFALGSIIGAAMVPLALASGVRALIAPVRFHDSPGGALALPLLAEVLFGVLALDGLLSRTDGSVLLLAFALSIPYLLRLSKRGLDIRPSGEIVPILDKGVKMPLGESVPLVVVSLGAMVIGSVLLVAGARAIIAEFGVPDTVFGMSALALLVALDGLVRELPGALKKHSPTGYGAVTGPTLALFLFNGGVIASLKPIPVSGLALSFHLPLAVVATLAVTAFMIAGKIPRWGGGLLVALYLAFFAGGFLLAAG